jgi:hypothetical protein
MLAVIDYERRIRQACRDPMDGGQKTEGRNAFASAPEQRVRHPRLKQRIARKAGCHDRERTTDGPALATTGIVT